MGLLNLFVKDSEIQALKKEIDTLREDKKKKKEELEELKLKKRLEQEEITHMQRINEEKNDQDVKRRKIELEKDYAEKITKFRDEQRQLLVDSLQEFHTKMEERFNSELGNLKDVYQALMARLPNVNLTLEKRLK